MSGPAEPEVERLPVVAPKPEVERLPVVIPEPESAVEPEPVVEPEPRQGIFICYRTTDTGAAAGRLADRLVDQWGEDRVFIDVESVQPGIDYREAVRTAIERARVMLVVIGDRWLAAEDRSGRPRILDEDDTLRIEIEYALEVGVKLLPVSVGGAEMPPRHELPANLARLTTINSLLLGIRTWRRDVRDVVQEVERFMAD
jgi:hypothetical protein